MATDSLFFIPLSFAVGAKVCNLDNEPLWIMSRYNMMTYILRNSQFCWKNGNVTLVISLLYKCNFWDSY